jgi:hypothetical protein
MLFLQIARHSPESCPIHNDEAKKAFMTFSSKQDELLKKNGIRKVGGWVSMPEHFIVFVYELSTTELMMKFMREPEVMAWQSYQIVETRPMVTFEEAMSFVK